MNDPAVLPPGAAGELTAADNDTVWYHRAFCRLALPVRAPSKGSWERATAGVALHMEAGEGATLPSGRLVRLLLIQLFDAAHRSGGAVIEIGDDPAALASRIGVEPAGPRLAELKDQMSRLLAARITIAWDGGPALSVFDARGRARAGAPQWRSSVRLTARFQAGLAAGAVALERHVLQALAESPAALDLYCWLASELPADATALTLAWDELAARFAQPSQTAVEFRAATEPALLAVQQAWPHFASVIRDDAVEFRRSAPPPAMEPRAPAPRAPEPAAAAEPAPEPIEPPPELTLEEELESAAEPGEPSRRVLRQSVSLKPHLTGLPQVVWLQRANGRDTVVIEVTPGGRYDADQSTVIALEPVALQVWGGLYARDFERVAAWAAANRDLIDDWWDSRVNEFEEVVQRVKKVPAPAWR
jgi:hypothetical protein